MYTQCMSLLYLTAVWTKNIDFSHGYQHSACVSQATLFVWLCTYFWFVSYEVQYMLSTVNSYVRLCKRFPQLAAFPVSCTAQFQQFIERVILAVLESVFILGNSTLNSSILDLHWFLLCLEQLCFGIGMVFHSRSPILSLNFFLVKSNK